MTNQIRLTRYRVISRWIVLSFVVCLALFVLLPGSAGAKDKKPTIITIDVPKAVGSVATIALNINPEGQITGNYLDANSMPHGFVRDPDGNFTCSFDGALGALVTAPVAINPAGEITGFYYASDGSLHGFLLIP